MTLKKTPAGAQSSAMMTLAQKKKSDFGWHHFFERLAAEKTTDTRQALPQDIQE
ncbi:hypothetical protein [Tritonibacter mobilis]|jgi:hypothetical protein|uniref:hypothetical protein n=1 Tax=Tritonibacter mobilis TaxID=379347 RepID=UPI001401C23C|nr:hypothetical protein [Tritonibacter mobilis]NHM20363.1 hypothetical protein [Tritonibacter mobilis]NHM24527.1 hypothetical protein [Tritonibacter mobilis]